MQGLKELLLSERERLARIVKKTKEQLEDAPKGTLRISRCKKSFQFYHCTEENRTGKYIAKKNTRIIMALAQKSYDKRVLQLANKRLKQLELILMDYADNEIDLIYRNEHEEKQKLIHPVEEIWENKLNRWKLIEYQGKGFQDGPPVIMTERGERVRSKTEKIMADYFYRNGIEYKYECPLILEGVGVVYPDFTFLSRKTGEEIYWEHCGMVDNPTYARKMVRKIETYENNGIFQGEKLILTYETEQTILGTDKIAQMVERYL